jgi:hypothetical protein
MRSIQKGLLIVGVWACASSLSAQELTKAFLRKMDWYKYSNISVFEADASAMKRFKETFTPSLPRTAGLEAAEQECTNTDDIRKRINKKQPVPQSLIDEGGSPQDCEVVKLYYTNLASLVQIGKVYILTERYQEGNEPNILGVIPIQAPSQAQAADPDFLKNSLNAPLGTGLMDAADLRQFKTKEFEKDDSTGQMVPVKGAIESTGSENMYDYLKAIIKQNPAEKTNLIRPSQTVAMKINKEIVTKMIAEDKVSDYQMISEGEPHKAFPGDKTFYDEITIGVADLISWRHYEDPANVQGEPTNLPKYGAELRFGNDEIGYPSLWSQRVTANVLWDGVKLGAVLPSSLWAPQLLSFLNTPQRQTNLREGIGINGAVDFPFKLIDRSGVFNAAGAFLIGRNVQYLYQGAFANPFETGTADSVRFRKSFLMRWHATAAYSFAIGINDPDKENLGYFIRFKIGFGAYQMEEWQRTSEWKRIPDPVTNMMRFQTAAEEMADTPPTLTQITSSLKASPLVRVEYMGAGLSAPFGASLQYFDGAVTGHIWIQVPISDTGFLTAIRVDGRGFLPLIRGPYEWENTLVGIPSLRFIFRW